MQHTTEFLPAEYSLQLPDFAELDLRKYDQERNAMRRMMVFFVVSIWAVGGLCDTRIHSPRNERQKRELFRVISMLRSAVRNQCYWCIEGLLTEEAISSNQFNSLIQEIENTANTNRNYTKSAATTSTWDFDIFIDNVDNLEDSSADISITYHLYRDMLPTKQPRSNSNSRRTISFHKVEGKWKIDDLSGLVAFLQEENSKGQNMLPNNLDNIDLPIELR